VTYIELEQLGSIEAWLEEYRLAVLRGPEGSCLKGVSFLLENHPKREALEMLQL
jgi:hypothetical protein